MTASPPSASRCAPGASTMPGAALFTASVQRLWDQTARELTPALCRELGITRTVLRQHLRLSFGKVIEYQARGLIHVHAVIRADGPEGPGAVAPLPCIADIHHPAIKARSSDSRSRPPRRAARTWSNAAPASPKIQDDELTGSNPAWSTTSKPDGSPTFSSVIPRNTPRANSSESPDTNGSDHSRLGHRAGGPSSATQTSNVVRSPSAAVNFAPISALGEWPPNRRTTSTKADNSCDGTTAAPGRVSRRHLAALKRAWSSASSTAISPRRPTSIVITVGPDRSSHATRARTPGTDR